MIFDVYLVRFDVLDAERPGKLISCVKHVAVPRGPFDPRTPPEGAFQHLGPFDDVVADMAINQAIAFGHRRRPFNQLPKKV